MDTARAILPAMIRIACLVAFFAEQLVIPHGADVFRSAAAPEVTVNELEYEFAESLSFRMETTSDQPVVDVVLRYVVGDSLVGDSLVGDNAVRNRRIPEFEPGTNITARHEERLARGQIPPASDITWWWTITVAGGLEYDTDRRSEIYIDRDYDWQSTDSAQATVWWYGDDPELALRIADRADRALDRVATIIGSEPDRRIDIVTYRTLDDMREALVSRGEVYEARLATLGARVAPDILLLLADRDRARTEDILSHELSHIVLHLSFAEDYVEAPLWLDEGIAMYSEGPLEDDEQAVLDAAILSDSIMSVRSLTSFPGQADLVPLAYAESRDLVAFLIDSYGVAEFHRLLERIGGGEMTADEALQATYGIDQDSLYQEYRRALGLGPASTPEAPTERTSAPSSSPSSSGGLCMSVGLVIPALALAARRRRYQSTAPVAASPRPPAESPRRPA